MHYYDTPKVKNKDGVVTVYYKSLTRLALATPAAEQQNLFDGKQYENGALGEKGDKYVF